mmetsp:Transcript_10796/g.26932  ORF Transcript_10796/g.26932 Transcript_10796/m.26932 type:complete len:164 (+) Transcript_10796:52-543(+)|eukprot:CAMPEP_0115233740 /NCGR_PEP_ID=MMETSP0270-20121206/34434_1 /TAXON_ID=71861 /ORGANISM="Scrippsiella trochoidea, Strain CCMP3099" /LENGTH=163 /DNA_ID=CAMNT_0002648467 /DNA_START=110 /DNA_END=601 /DNA_ORIENTATION=-
MAARQRQARTALVAAIIGLVVAKALLSEVTLAANFACPRGISKTTLRPVSMATPPRIQMGAESGSGGFQIEETKDNSQIMAAAICFVFGLLFFPIFKGFNCGLILAVLGYTLTNGTASDALGKNESGKEFAEPVSKFGELLLKAGDSGVKTVNWAAKKVEDLQ